MARSMVNTSENVSETIRACRQLIHRHGKQQQPNVKRANPSANCGPCTPHAPLRGRIDILQAGDFSARMSCMSCLRLGNFNQTLTAINLNLAVYDLGQLLMLDRSCQSQKTMLPHGETSAWLTCLLTFARNSGPPHLLTSVLHPLVLRGGTRLAIT